MRVILLTENLELGGINRYCLDLAYSLRNYPHLEVYLIALASSNDHWMVEQAKKMGISMEIISGRWDKAISDVYKKCSDRHVAILHTQGYRSSMIGRAAVKVGGLPIKLLNTVHGAYHFSSAPLKSKIYYVLDYATMRVSDKIITVSSATARQINRLGLQDKIAVIPNGTSHQYWQDKVAPLGIYEQLKIPQECKIICFVGRLSPQKGIVQLAEVMRRTIRLDDNVAFLIVGDGELLPLLKKVSLEHPAKVFLMGWQADVSQFYAVSDLLVLTSVTEGLPMTLLEGFAHGLPAVATRVGGVPEVIEDGCNGFLCNPFDVEKMTGSLLQLLQNDSLRTNFSNNARRTAREKFSLELMAQKTYEVYRHLLASL